MFKNKGIRVDRMSEFAYDYRPKQQLYREYNHLELLRLRATKLFTKEEFSKLVEEGNKFTNQVYGYDSTVQDFKDYIKRELALVREIKKRNKQKDQNPKVIIITNRMEKRIRYLYDIALLRFPTDFELHAGYIFFADAIKFTQGVAWGICKLQVAFYPLIIAWQFLARFLLKSSRDQAIHIIKLGLRRHPQSTHLHNDHLAMLLDLRKRTVNQPPFDYDLVCQDIQEAVNAMFIEIKDLTFYIEVIKKIKNHDFLKGVVQSIVKHMLDNYTTEGIVWDIAAQLERQGHHFGLEKDAIQPHSRFRLDRCIEKYQEGLTKLCDAEKKFLWQKYLDFMFEVRNENIRVNMMTNKLQEELIRCSKENNLSDVSFVAWSQLFRGENTLNILKLGLQHHPDSVLLWEKCLQIHVDDENTGKFNKVFKRSIFQLKEKSLRMWILAVRYYSLISDNSLIDNIYQDAIRQPEEVSSIMKVEYIQWLNIAYGIEETRRVYNTLAKQEPYCRELHEAMIKIESTELQQDLVRLETINRNISTQFSDEPFSRVELIRFYVNNAVEWKKLHPSFELRETVKQLITEGEEFYRGTPKLRDFQLACVCLQVELDSL